MQIQRTLLLAAGLGALVTTPARGADMRPMSLQDVTGELQIEQTLPWPCDNVFQTTPVVHGRMEMAPGEDAVWDAGQRLFVLTRASVAFAPFSIHRSCVGQNVTRSYTEVGVQLGKAVLFRASPAGPNVFQVLIPRGDVVLHQAATVNGQPEIGDQHPMEDITGQIDLGAGTVEMLVKVATKVHVDFFGDYNGTLTASLSGRIVRPDFDKDGVPNHRDNCKLVPNPTQTPVESPVLRAPHARTLHSCIYRDLGTPTATDVCHGGPVTVTNNAPPKLPVGTTIVTWQAQDDYGGGVTQPQEVTVVDTAPPVFTSVPGPVVLNNCVSANLGLPTGYDDCAGPLAFTNDAPATFPRGSTPVTWTITDASGNPTHATSPQVVTVTDAIKPSVACSGVVDPEDAHAALFRVAAHDACTASPVIQFGTYTLRNGERVKMSPQQLPGIVFVGLVGPEQIRHFRVGPNNNLIRGVDAAGNFRTATCTVTSGPHL